MPSGFVNKANPAKIGYDQGPRSHFRGPIMDNHDILSYSPPTVIETTARGERSFDIFSRLLRERIVFLGMEIDSVVANIIVSQLLFLEAEDPEKDIRLYINSPGGDVDAGLAIYDTIQHIRSQVSTICLGQAASMGAILLSGGAKGKRLILPHSRVMIHQPLGGMGHGQASDIAIFAEEMLKTKKLLNEILAANCGQPLKQVEKDTDRDYIMTAEQSLKYGLVDHVIEPQKKSDTTK